MNFKKPKFWDYKKPNFIAYLLFPITLLLTLNNLLLKIYLTNFTNGHPRDGLSLYQKNKDKFQKKKKIKLMRKKYLMMLKSLKHIKK